MRLLAATLGVAGLVVVVPSPLAAPPAARLVTRPPATEGAAWTARLALRTPPARRPVVIARSGQATQRATVTRRSPTVFLVRLRFRFAGRWRLEARLGRASQPLGSVVVRERGATQPRGEIRIETPAHVALDARGRLLVVEGGRNRVLALDPASGRITRFAGTGTVLLSGDGAPATAAGIGSPFGIAAAPDGEIFVTSDDRLRRIDAAGRISTAAVAPAQLGPIATDDRAVWFAAADTKVYRYDRATRAVTHVAGTGATGFDGDGGLATLAAFSAPHGIAVAPDGGVLVADTGNDRVRRIDPLTGVVTTIASGLTGSWGLAVAPDGALYAGAATANRIYRLDSGGTATLVAGDGSIDSSGDGGPAVAAGLPSPLGMAASRDALYVVEWRAGRIRRIDLGTGTISTLRSP